MIGALAKMFRSKPTDLALGQAVMTELDFARTNEGPQ
jgi:hypothetical protein